MILQMSVILSTGGYLADTTPGQTPPRQTPLDHPLDRHRPGQTPPLGRNLPHWQTPPMGRHPAPGQNPLGRHICMQSE